MAIYAAGLLALSAADFIVSGFLDEMAVAQWAEVRSLIGTVGIFCLLGLDSVFVRNPGAARQLLRILAIQVPLVALPIAIAVHGAGYLTGYIQSYALAIASAGTIALYQFYRSRKYFVLSQLTQQGWRIASFALIVALLFLPSRTSSIDLAVTWILVGVFAACLVGFRGSWREIRLQEISGSASGHYRIGARFLLTSVLLALATYGEQLLVQGVGSVDDAASYFTHATFFLFPMAVLNGYLGFLLAPWVRDNHDKFVSILRHRRLLTLVAVTASAALLHCVGLLAWQVLEPASGQPNSALRAIFFLTSVFVALYQLPSAYNGVFASVQEHDILIVAQVISLVVGVLTAWALLRFVSVGLLLSVAAGASVNWLLRTALSCAVLAVAAQRWARLQQNTMPYLKIKA